MRACTSKLSSRHLYRGSEFGVHFLTIIFDRRTRATIGESARTPNTTTTTAITTTITGYYTRKI
jgi:hypothetical protein